LVETRDPANLKTASSSATTVTILNPNNSTLASISSSLFATFLEPVTVGSTGTHTLKVDPNGANSGTTTLNLHDVPADTTGTVTVGGSAVPVTLSTPGQNGSLTFSGTASQQVTVRITGNTMGYVTVKLLKPDGSQLTSSFAGSSSFDLATQTLPVTGTYTVVVDPYQWNIGTLNVAVTSP